MTLSDVLLALGILLLLFEVIKGARPGAKYLTDHLLSLLVFGGAAAEFVLLPQFGTSTFFLLTLLALVDFLSGIALRARRRRSRRRDAPVAESRAASASLADGQRREPRAGARAGSPRRAGSPVAEPCRWIAPEPTTPHPEVDAVRTPRRRSASPGLQPGDSAHPSPDTPR